MVYMKVVDEVGHLHLKYVNEEGCPFEYFYQIEQCVEGDLESQVYLFNPLHVQTRVHTYVTHLCWG
jgi:hypothetical protein